MVERKLRFKPRKTFNADLKHLATIDHQIVDEVRAAIEVLLTGHALPAEFGDHQLQRRLADYHEFHLRDTPKGQQPNERNDIVVIYAVDEDDLILIGIRIGTHDKLFFKQNHANK